MGAWRRAGLDGQALIAAAEAVEKSAELVATRPIPRDAPSPPTPQTTHRGRDRRRPRSYHHHRGQSHPRPVLTL